MKLTFLGTGACEGIPFLWCNCAVCQSARKGDSPDRRARTALAIDDSILVDFGPDARAQLLKYGIDTTHVRHLLISHSHCDHFSPQELLLRTREYAPVSLEVIANQTVLDALRDKAEQANLLLRFARPGTWLEGTGGTRFLPIEAAHCGPEEQALNYVIEGTDGRRCLVAADTGWYPAASWRQLADVQADAAVLEMSYGIRAPYDQERRAHLGASSTIAMKEELVRIGALKQDAPAFATHISHCSNCTHDEITAFFRHSGIVPAFDGLQVSC